MGQKISQKNSSNKSSKKIKKLCSQKVHPTKMFTTSDSILKIIKPHTYAKKDFKIGRTF